MTTELPKTYDPAAVESGAYRVWLDEKCFHADPAAPGEPYCIVIPPPNVTGALHLGHAINNTLQDVLIRAHRMKGFNTLWVPGIDHAGIATQAVVEKQLKEKENKTRHDVGREALVARIWEWKQQYGDRILEQLKRMGCSCDWDRTRFTLDEMCARAVRETFFKLFKDGLIFRGKRLVNWDVFLQTSVSDDEIYYETVKTSLWHIKYPVVDDEEARRHEGTKARREGNEPDASKPSASPSCLSASVPSCLDRDRPTHVVVATTRPETMLGDTAVAVHPDDPRWNWAIGKKVKLPLTDRLIPIIADPILVDPKFGTGVVKVTPAHDPNDYATWQRHKGHADEIDILNIITPDGKINENGGRYAGMKREAARKKVVDDLAGQGLLAKEEPYETQVGHSDRSKTPIEPYLSDQWFVRMAPLAEPALEVVRDGIIKFFPERHAQQYLAWLGEKRDWPISRQLWWGHRIPVWTIKTRLHDGWIENEQAAGAAAWCADGDEAEVVLLRADGSRIDVQFHGDVPPTAEFLEHSGEVTIQVALRGRQRKHVRTLEDAGFIQDPDVLDTWFSSALWPHSTLGWPEDTPELRKWYPTSVLVTARDIITLWVARMVMMGMYNMGQEEARRHEGTAEEARRHEGTAEEARRHEGTKARREENPPSASEPSASPSCLSASVPSCLSGEVPSCLPKQLGIPFLAVSINPTILDGKGERMSKSKGNGVDPVDIIETHGADALRYTLTAMATETQDARLPAKKLPNGKNTSDKFDVGRNFCNKIWNAVRFALQNLASIPPEPVDEAKWSLLDRWILSRLMRTIKEVDEALANYRFDVYAKVCYDFFWRDLCDWYIEAIKPQLKVPSSIASPDSPSPCPLPGVPGRGEEGRPARRGQVANVLAACLDVSLRLLHPIIPFITETIWWKLNEIRPDRAIPGRINFAISGGGSGVSGLGSSPQPLDPSPFPPRLIHAPWPLFNDAITSEGAEFVFSRLQELIVAIRNLRNEYKVDLKKPVTVSISAPGDSARQINANKSTIELLALCTIRDARADLQPPTSAARTSAAGCEVFVEGLVDQDAEKQRLAKRKEELAKQIAALQGRLANPSYATKAPPHLVEQTRKQLADAEAELAKLR